MKKAGTFLLLGLTLIFVGFVIGMLVGRNIQGDAVTVQVAPEMTIQNTIPTAHQDAETVAKLININTASVEMLDTLPGVGPVIAKRIVDFRNEHGPFQQVTDIAMVEGIGPEKLLTLLDFITVED